VRSVPSVLVVDAAILISALIGRSAGALSDIGRTVQLATTDRAMVEASRRVALGLKRPELVPLLSMLVAEFEVVPLDDLEEIADAVTSLRETVPSRNGSTSDAHILALAWKLGADIWSHDRDFAGTGVANWSTANLVRTITLAES
jgi:predicted nucleic acid-binding protein